MNRSKSFLIFFACAVSAGRNVAIVAGSGAATNSRRGI